VPGQPYDEQFGPIGFPGVQRPGPRPEDWPRGYTAQDAAALRTPGFNDCDESRRQLEEETVFNAVSAPHHEPPFNARSVIRTFRAVINVPAAFDAAANAAGIALAAAEGVIVAVPLLTPTVAVPPFGAVQVASITTPPGHATVWRRGGILVANSRPEAGRFELTASGGPNTSPDGPTNLSSSSLTSEREDVLVIVPENRALMLRVENLDTASPILVTITVSGWTLPFTGYTDDVRGLYPRRGYGRNACRPPGRRP
jgi:hypothetical protein